MQVLFDTLKFHGAAFTTPFWTRIFDSVLLPIFDHVRAEVCSWLPASAAALRCYTCSSHLPLPLSSVLAAWKCRQVCLHLCCRRRTCMQAVKLSSHTRLCPQVTDTTTFTDEMKRAEVDSWLYETCTQCLQHMVDVFVQYYSAVKSLLTRILDLLSNFIRCCSSGGADLQACTALPGCCWLDVWCELAHWGVPRAHASRR